MKKGLLFLVGILVLVPAVALGAGLDNVREGNLLIAPAGSRMPDSRRIEREQLKHLCFFSKRLIAEKAAIRLHSLEIAVEADNLSRRSWQAAQMSAQNTDKVWLRVKRQQAGETEYQYYEASAYRLVQYGKLAGETNQMIVEFTNLDLTAAPGETLVLAFCGSFYPYMPAGTVIRGKAVPEAWRHTARAVRFEGLGDEPQYIVQ